MSKPNDCMRCQALYQDGYEYPEYLCLIRSEKDLDKNIDGNCYYSKKTIEKKLKQQDEEFKNEIGLDNNVSVERVD